VTRRFVKAFRDYGRASNIPHKRLIAMINIQDRTGDRRGLRRAAPKPAS
jgi:hypothetical protein